MTGYLPPGVHDALWFDVAARFAGNAHRGCLMVGLLSACRRAAMKEKYLGDLFPASALAAPGVLYRDFFKTDRSGVEKGVVLIALGSLP